MALLDTNTQVSAIIGDFGSGLDHHLQALEKAMQSTVTNEKIPRICA